MKYTRQQMLESIVRFYKENGRVPRYEEFTKKNGYPNHGTIVKYFGSWNKAIEEAGFAVNRLVNLTEEELLIYLKRFEDEYDRPPVASELNNLKNNPRYPNLTQYIRRFGSLEKAKKLIDMDIDSLVKKGIIGTNIQKARLAEIFVMSHFTEDGAIDLAGKNRLNSADGVCPKKQIYDVKSSSFIDNYWQFFLDKKGKVDFYYLLAFNRDYSELKYVWRIPVNFTDNTHLYIRPGDVINMRKYEITNKFNDVFKKWKESLGK